MLSYIKKYPVSLFIILTVIYLSFFKPPKTDLNETSQLRQGSSYLYVFRYVGNVMVGIFAGAPQG